MKIKGNYLVIATNIKEIHDEIGVRMISKSRYNDVSKVLLMLCAESPIKDGLVCDQEFEKQISYIRRNIYAGNRHKHHGSSGYMYGIGVAAKYKLVNGMSVDEYAHKNYSKDFEKKVHSDVGTWLSDCIGNLESKCNGIMEMLTLSNMAMLCASMDISKMNGTESVMKNLVSNCNDKTVCFPAAFLCVNSETHVLHTEKDCAFTAIYVLAQCTSHNNVKFQLLIYEGENVFLHMKPHVSIIYSGFLLTHRQIGNFKNGDKFYNICAYSNKRLYECFRKGLLRSKENNLTEAHNNTT